jgi:biotin/methionine sulfoxide reductase
MTNEQRFQSLSHWGAFTAVVAGERVVRCEPFARDPAPSPMLDAIPAMVHSPLRVARPAVRESWLRDRAKSDGSRRGREAFVEIGWDEALRLVAGELARVRAEHGAGGIFGGSYGWASAGRFHHARTQLRRFLFAGGGCVDQVGNYSWGAAQFLLPHVIGTFAPVTGRVTDWASIVAATKVLVAFGGLAIKNGQVTSGGAGEHTMAKWLRAAKDAGVEFVVVSPTRADAPDFLGAQWLPVRPNTDAALMLGIAHALIAERLHDEAFLARYCSGFARLRDYILGDADGTAKTPEWAARICEIPAESIRALARRLAANRSMITVAWSLQRAQHGEQPYWMAIALAGMLGQIGLPGGGFAFGHGSMNGVGNPRLDVPAAELPIKVNPAARAIPVARVGDMLVHPREPFEFNGNTDYYPDVRLVYWAGGNPFHHHQDLNRFRLAWAKPETVIVHESWWTATARHADIVLPATTMLERNDVGGSSRDRYVFAMHQAIKPVAASRNDFDMFNELAARLGCEDAFNEGRSEMQWLRWIWDGVREGAGARGVELPDFSALWERGYVELPPPDKPFVLFESFRADPTVNPLRTPSGKIELYSERIASFGYDDCPPHPAWLAPEEWLGAPAAQRHPLHLVTIQPPDRLHAQMDPGPVAQANKVAGREPIRLSPGDAAKRRIKAGQVVRVFNERGACLAGAVIDAGVRDGVAVMATGAWYAADAKGLELAGNPNVLSLDVGTSRLAQGCAALSVLVEVERYAGKAPLPPVSAPVAGPALATETRGTARKRTAARAGAVRKRSHRTRKTARRKSL